MNAALKNTKVAILATHGFEQSELLEPKRALEDAGVETTVIAPEEGSIRGWSERNWGDEVAVDLTLEQANPEQFDLLVLPGGVMNPDKLRMNEAAIEFIRRFFSTGKPIAAICHGPWTLIEADAVAGLRMTSYRSIRSDLENAGAEWVDEPVVEDGNLITSRQPKDLPQFIERILARLQDVRAEASALQEETRV